MSKEAALRAMREARYAERTAKAAGAAQGSTRAAPVRPAVAKASKPESVQEAAAPPEGLCGHRSMNGRTCTREAGHAAKSHRYG